jgi:hypothetical protein
MSTREVFVGWSLTRLATSKSPMDRVADVLTAAKLGIDGVSGGASNAGAATGD